MKIYTVNTNDTEHTAQFAYPDDIVPNFKTILNTDDPMNNMVAAYFGHKVTLAISTLEASKPGIVMNLHNHEEEKIAGIGILTDGRLFPICDARYFSINELIITTTSIPRISTNSIAGTVNRRGAIEESLLGYNADCVYNPMFIQNLIVGWVLFE